MFDFFLAIIFIPYYLFRYLLESRENDRLRKEKMDDKARREAWQEKVLDADMEARFRELLGDRANHSQFEEELNAAIEEIPWILEFVPYNGKAPTTVFKLGTDISLLILMVNRGKLPLRVVSWGIKGYSRFHKSNPYFREAARASYLATWLDKKLREHGIKEELVLDYDRDKIYRVTGEDMSDKIYGGVYTWMPTINTYRMKYITDFTG